MDKNILTQDALKEKLNYNSLTGAFSWKNSNYKISAGDIAGHLHKSGYVQITVNYKQYLAHRLAWLYVYGENVKEIDHINNNRSDNSIINLRKCSRAENMRNKSSYKNSKSGIKGVSYCEESKKWRARCTVNNKEYYLGLFETAHQARLKYNEFAMKNHAEFFKI